MLAWLFKCLSIFTRKKKYGSTKSLESAFEYNNKDSIVSPQEGIVVVVEFFYYLVVRKLGLLKRRLYCKICGIE